MVKLFNWRELCVTYSMKEQASLRDILDVRHIPHKVKTVSRTGSSRSLGTSGMDLEKMYEYRIFVRKSDLEQARHHLDSHREKKN